MADLRFELIIDDKGSTVLRKVGKEAEQTAKRGQDAFERWGGSSRRMWLDMAKGFVAAQLSIQAVTRAVRGMVGIFSAGIRAIDDLKVSSASLAGILISMGAKMEGVLDEPLAQYRAIGQYTVNINEQLELWSVRTLASADQLRKMNEMLAQAGVVIDANNEKHEKFMIGLANMISTMAQGQNMELQFLQETRALFDGTVRQTSRIATYFDTVIPGGLEKAMAEAKDFDDLITNYLLPHMSGFDQAADELSLTWTALKATMETIAKKVLREGFGEAYGDVMGWVRQLRDYFIDQNGELTEQAKVIKEGIRGGWALVKPVLEDVLGILGKIAETTAYIASLLAPLTDVERIKKQTGALEDQHKQLERIRESFERLLAGTATFWDKLIVMGRQTGPMWKAFSVEGLRKGLAEVNKELAALEKKQAEMLPQRLALDETIKGLREQKKRLEELRESYERLSKGVGTAEDKMRAFGSKTAEFKMKDVREGLEKITKQIKQLDDELDRMGRVRTIEIKVEGLEETRKQLEAHLKELDKAREKAEMYKGYSLGALGRWLTGAKTPEAVAKETARTKDELASVNKEIERLQKNLKELEKKGGPPVIPERPKVDEEAEKAAKKAKEKFEQAVRKFAEQLAFERTAEYEREREAFYRKLGGVSAEMVQEIMELYVTLVKRSRDALAAALSEGLKAGTESAGFDAFSRSLRESVMASVKQGLTDVFAERYIGELMYPIFHEVERLTAKLGKGEIAMPEYRKQIAVAIEEWKPKLEAVKPEFEGLQEAFAQIEEALGLTEEIAVKLEGVGEYLARGISAALEQADATSGFLAFKASLKESVSEAIRTGVVEGFIKAEVKKVMEPVFQDLATLLEKVRKGEITLPEVEEALPHIAKAIETRAELLKPLILASHEFGTALDKVFASSQKVIENLTATSEIVRDALEKGLAETGMTAGFETFRTTLEEGVYESVVRALIQGFMSGEVMAGAIEPFLQAFAETSEAYMRKEIGAEEFASLMAARIEELRATLPKFQPVFESLMKAVEAVREAAGVSAALVDFRASEAELQRFADRFVAEVRRMKDEVERIAESWKTTFEGLFVEVFARKGNVEDAAGSLWQAILGASIVELVDPLTDALGRAFATFALWFRGSVVAPMWRALSEGLLDPLRLSLAQMLGLGGQATWGEVLSGIGGLRIPGLGISLGNLTALGAAGGLGYWLGGMTGLQGGGAAGGATLSLLQLAGLYPGLSPYAMPLAVGGLGYMGGGLLGGLISGKQGGTLGGLGGLAGSLAGFLLGGPLGAILGGVGGGLLGGIFGLFDSSKIKAAHNQAAETTEAIGAFEKDLVKRLEKLGFAIPELERLTYYQYKGREYYVERLTRPVLGMAPPLGYTGEAKYGGFTEEEMRRLEDWGKQVMEKAEEIFGAAQTIVAQAVSAGLEAADETVGFDVFLAALGEGVYGTIREALIEGFILRGVEGQVKKAMVPLMQGLSEEIDKLVMGLHSYPGFEAAITPLIEQFAGKMEDMRPVFEMVFEVDRRLRDMLLRTVEGTEAAVKEMVRTIADALAAQTIPLAISEGFAQVGMVEGFRTFTETIREGVAQAVIGALVESFAASDVIKAAIDPLKEAFTEAGAALLAGTIDEMEYERLMEPALMEFQEAMERISPAFAALFDINRRIRETLGLISKPFAEVPTVAGHEEEIEEMLRQPLREWGVTPMAKGGVIEEPVEGLGLRTGRRYLLGEEGAEYVVPAEEAEAFRVAKGAVFAALAGQRYMLGASAAELAMAENMRMAEGGIIEEPVLAKGVRTGRDYLFGTEGAEEVVPAGETEAFKVAKGAVWPALAAERYMLGGSAAETTLAEAGRERTPVRMAYGGIITEPVRGVGLRSGRGYLFGESGEEIVTPARQPVQENIIHIHLEGAYLGDELTMRKFARQIETQFRKIGGTRQ